MRRVTVGVGVRTRVAKGVALGAAATAWGTSAAGAQGTPAAGPTAAPGQYRLVDGRTRAAVLAGVLDSLRAAYVFPDDLMALVNTVEPAGTGGGAASRAGAITPPRR